MQSLLISNVKNRLKLKKFVQLSKVTQELFSKMYLEKISIPWVSHLLEIVLKPPQGVMRFMSEEFEETLRKEVLLTIGAH